MALPQYVNKSITLPEVFDIVNSKHDKIDDKAAHLKLYDTRFMRWYIDSMFNRDFTNVPLPKPSEWKAQTSPPGICPMNIGTAINRIETAVQLAATKPAIAKKNLIIVLESVSAREAELLISLFKGERRVPGISKKVFKKAYPAFFRLEENDQVSS